MTNKTATTKTNGFGWTARRGDQLSGNAVTFASGTPVEILKRVSGSNCDEGRFSQVLVSFAGGFAWIDAARIA